MKKKITKIYSYSVLYEAAPKGGFAAFVPALPGCHTQGDTLEDAERNIAEAIGLYLESMAAHKNSIPQETKSFYGTVRIQVPALA